MKNKLYYILSSVVLIVAAMILLISAGCALYQKRRTQAYFKRYYNVTLTDSDKILYEVDHTGWMGEGMVYFVIGFDKEPEELITNRYFTSGLYAKGTEEERAEYRLKLEAGVKKMFTDNDDDFEKVPVEYRPDWQSDFMFKGNLINPERGTCYIYNPTDKTLIIWSVRT